MEYVYVADFGSRVKIGYTTSVENRIKNLESATKEKVINVYYEKAERPIEKALHSHFSGFRIEGEYFQIPFLVAKEALIDAVAHPQKYKPKKKPISESRKRANQKYIDKQGEIKVRVSKERKAEIQAHAESRGESVNGFINRAIDHEIERDTEGDS